MTGISLTIGQLARRAGVTPDTLRYYERVGLLPAAPRTSSGYRLYDPATLERLTFIGKAKSLGLTLDDVGEVLRIAASGTAPCGHVRARLSRRLRDVEARMAELEELRHTLARALRHRRAQSVAPPCTCELIESQALPRTGAAHSRHADSERRAITISKEKDS